jgi:hypothetical protein
MPERPDLSGDYARRRFFLCVLIPPNDVLFDSNAVADLGQYFVDFYPLLFLSNVLIYTCRNADTSRLGKRLQPCCNVDPVAENVAVLDDRADDPKS